MKINEKNLCLFATTPPYDFEGFLNKRGEVNKAFQRRYFVLKGNLLFYFEKRGDREPLGLIIVEGCTIELSEESDQYCFQMVFNGNRTYILSADNQDVMEAWMKVLTCAGYEYKKLMVAELQRQLEEIEDTKQKWLGESIQASTPKPPPRRHNPFNRPAPPPPQSAVANSGLSNGFTGLTIGPVTASRAESSSSDNLINADVTTTAMYGNVRQPPPTSSPTVSKRSAKPVLTTRQLFKKLHEDLRKEVLADVLEYQAKKELAKKPLVDI